LYQQFKQYPRCPTEWKNEKPSDPHPLKKPYPTKNKTETVTCEKLLSVKSPIYIRPVEKPFVIISMKIS
jgi:hypothetical protein